MRAIKYEVQKLRDIVTLGKGKPPAQQPYFGPDAELYLTPEYLRGRGTAEPVKASVNAVRVLDNETIVLWDGSNAEEFFRARKGILASTMSRISHDDTFDKEYFFYAVKSWESFLKGQTSGSGIPHVDKEVLGKIEIFQFPKPEQTKIAEILSTVDRAIEQTEALIAKQQRIKTGLMQDLLTRGIDEEGNLRSEQTHEFKDSPLGRIPVEWNVKPLGTICELIKDGTHLPPARVSEGPLLLGVQNMVDGKLTKTSSDTRVPWDFYEQMHQNWKILAGDVFLAIVGATIGKTCLAPTNLEPYTLQRSVALIRGERGILHNRFLLQYLKSPFFQSIIHTKTNSTAQAGLYLSQIADFYFPVCPIEEQIAISIQLEGINNLGESYTRTGGKLRSLKTALMQDLLTGKKRVIPLLESEKEATA
ncbi:MAG: restriction endonuclease subunit S [Anaerolineaceae bacterium]|nr:restriction endonuclease subunit S [Anaerolineaceae bacterium]